MHAAALVGDALVGLERDARRGGVGEDRHELAPVHEGLALLHVDVAARALHVARGAVGVGCNAAAAPGQLRDLALAAQHDDELVQRVGRELHAALDDAQEQLARAHERRGAHPARARRRARRVGAVLLVVDAALVVGKAPDLDREAVAGDARDRERRAARLARRLAAGARAPLRGHGRRILRLRGAQLARRVGQLRAQVAGGGARRRRRGRRRGRLGARGAGRGRARRRLTLARAAEVVDDALGAAGGGEAGAVDVAVAAAALE